MPRKSHPPCDETATSTASSSTLGGRTASQAGGGPASVCTRRSRSPLPAGGGLGAVDHEILREQLTKQHLHHVENSSAKTAPTPTLNAVGMPTPPGWRFPQTDYSSWDAALRTPG